MVDHKWSRVSLPSTAKEDELLLEIKYQILFKGPKKTFERSKLIKQLLQIRNDPNEPIIAAEVDPRALKPILSWLTYMESNTPTKVPKPLRKGLHEYVSPYEWEFLTTACLEGGDDKKHLNLLRILKAANFLGIQELCELTTAMLAYMLKGSGIDQVHSTFEMELKGRRLGDDDYEKLYAKFPWMREHGWLKKPYHQMEDYERHYTAMDAEDKMAFCLAVILCNIEAYDDATKTASESFLTWDILEDAMPFLTQPAIEVDIQWTQNELNQKMLELSLENHQTTVILINPSQLNVIPEDSVALGSPSNPCKHQWNYRQVGYSGSPSERPCVIYSLLDPTLVVMDATMSNVRELGHGFLRGCSSLKVFNLSALYNVQMVGFSFLSECSSLKKVNPTALTNVQEVGYGFLCGCSSLEEVDVSALFNPHRSIQRMGGFLQGCSSLTRVILPASFHFMEEDLLRNAVQRNPK